MITLKIKFDEETEWLCGNSIPISNSKNYLFEYSESFIGIPLKDINSLKASDIFEKINFFKQHAEAIELFEIAKDANIYIHNDCNESSLNKYIDLANAVNASNLADQYDIDINKFILKCQIQLQMIEREKQKEAENEKILLAKKQKQELKIKETGFIYVLKSQFGYKIGKTKNPKRRHAQFGIKLPFDFEKIFEIEVEGYHKHEIKLHTQFLDKKINGEWFNLEKSDLKLIQNYLENHKVPRI